MILTSSLGELMEDQMIEYLHIEMIQSVTLGFIHSAIAGDR